MRIRLYLLLSIVLWIGCMPSYKELSDSDIQYNEDNNTWCFKSSGSVIKDNFVTNDGLLDGIPFKRVVVVDKEGHMLSLKHYIDDKIIKDGDYTKAPEEYTEKIYPNHPLFPYDDIYYHYSKKTKDGSTMFVKDSQNNTVAEVLFDKNGETTKVYEWKDGKRVIPMSDQFVAENIATSFDTDFYTSYPVIKFKIRNKSGKTINELIKLDYKFVYKDEIIDSNFKLVSSDAGWDNNLVKSVVIKSIKSVRVGDYNKKPTDVTVVITFKDGSLLYEGPIYARIEGFQ